MSSDKEKLILNDLLDQIGYKINNFTYDKTPVEIPSTYVGIYSNYPDLYKTIFSIFHQRLNQLFEFMNTKINSNHHYNAEQSRELLDVIDKIENLIFSLKRLGIKIVLKNEYQQVLLKCKKFLVDSYGSDIPETFGKIVLIKYDPIFLIAVNNFQDMPTDIGEKIRLISTRGADFDNMELDEKLSQLNILIENLLKQEDKYVKLDYKKVFFGFLSEDDIKGYRKQTHCFRHGTKEALENRKIFSEEQKELLSDLGIFIAIHIYKFLSN